jgi:hypothetical protein
VVDHAASVMMSTVRSRRHVGQRLLFFFSGSVVFGSVWYVYGSPRLFPHAGSTSTSSSLPPPFFDYAITLYLKGNQRNLTPIYQRSETHRRVQQRKHRQQRHSSSYIFHRTLHRRQCLTACALHTYTHKPKEFTYSFLICVWWQVLFVCVCVCA